MPFILLISLAAAPLPDGDWWVPRIASPASTRSDGTKTERSFRVSCEKLEVRGVLVKLGDFTFNQRDGRLFAPVLPTHLRTVSLSKHCSAEAPDVPRFESRAACVEAGSGVTETCEGGACTFDRRPFTLPGCDAALLELRELANLVLDAEHPRAAQTFERFTALTKKGGRLWERGSCAAVTVKPVKGGTLLRGADWETEGVFEPLFSRARLSGLRGWSADGGLGSWGTSATTEALYLGDGLLILGTRVLYVDEGGCVAARKKL